MFADRFGRPLHGLAERRAGQRSRLTLAFRSARNELPRAIDDRRDPAHRIFLVAEKSRKLARGKFQRQEIKRLVVPKYRRFDAGDEHSRGGIDADIRQDRHVRGKRSLMPIRPHRWERVSDLQGMRGVEKRPSFRRRNDEPGVGQTVEYLRRRPSEFGQISLPQRSRMGERVGDDKIFVEFRFDDAGERMRRRDKESTSRLTFGFRKAPDHEEGDGDQRQRHDKRQQPQVLSQRQRRLAVADLTAFANARYSPTLRFLASRPLENAQFPKPDAPLSLDMTRHRLRHWR